MCRILIALTFAVGVLTSAFAQKRIPEMQAQINGLPERSTLVNINNISMWIRADGWSGRNPFSGDAGVIFPRGTTHVVFQDGIIWVGLVKDGKTPELRAGGQSYNVGTVEGRIISKGVAEDPNDPDVRIWRIRRDWRTADLRRDAAELNNVSIEAVTEAQIAEVREQYEQDWEEWPWEKGAPFYDDNTNGIMDSGEQPGLADADQVVWFVANDLSFAAPGLYGSPSIGLELQGTLWAYREPAPLDHVIFKRYRLIYKGTADTPDTARIDSMYLAQWSDPDLGTYTDDFVGVDTLLSLGYVYNSSHIDDNYNRFDLPPPAGGYVLLSSPIGETENGQPLTSFVHVESVSAPLGSYQHTIMNYNLVRGFPQFSDPINPEPIRDPDGNPTKFMYSGDPVAGTGWIDGQILPPGDRRMMMNSGPFTMALGDTQEITVALVAGLGADNLTSISAMRFHGQDIQVLFDHGFRVPEAPKSPKLQISELDHALLLNWGFDQNAVEQTEHSTSGGYRFEGYNVYQLPSPEAGLDEAVKIATFDLRNGVRGIPQREIDPETGLVIVKVAQQGKDTGIQYTLHVTRDSLKSKSLINYQSYHFAVTAYNYNPDGLTSTPSLESPLVPVTATPHPPQPGVSYPIRGDTLTVTHDGHSMSEVDAIVVDPTQTTGHTYKVTFERLPDGEIGWSLWDATVDSLLLQKQTNQSGDEQYLVVDGVLVKVVIPPADFLRTPNGNPAIIEIHTDTGPAETDTNGEPFGGNFVWHSLSSEQSDRRQYFISACEGVDDDALTNNGETLSHLVPFDLEVRFTSEADGSPVWWAFEDGSVAQVPIQLWNVGLGTHDDPTDDTQLIPVAFSGGEEQGGTPGVFDVVSTVTEGAFGFPGFDCLFFYSGDFDAYTADAMDGTVEADAREKLLLANFMIADFSLDRRLPGAGTVIRILTTKTPLPGEDEFTFSTPEPEFELQAAREEVQSVNVFPNPFIGETGTSGSFVTFTHLPPNATIRIYTLAGHLVKKIEKVDDATAVQWDLTNAAESPVASGIYLVHIEMPELDEVKVLKLVIVNRKLY